MKVSHQIRSRREALGLSLQDLAQKAKVTEQAVRHWESGRSYPSKAKARLIEQTLQFNIDWTEGVRTSGDDASATAMINPKDLDLLLVLCKLPADMKGVVERLAALHLKAVEGARFIERERSEPIASFQEKEGDDRGSRKGGRSRVTQASGPKGRSRSGNS